MMRISLMGAALAALIVISPKASAWSSAGHMVIAAEAWRELPAETKSKVLGVLKAHPEFERWQTSFSGEPGDLAAFIFMRASTWPDEIRRHGHKFDHPHWHYTDYPLKPSRFPMEPAPSPNDDALFGIAQCEKILSNKEASAEDRAAYLSWMIHLIGDLHQPLHCASLFNDTYPAGDKGGNDFYVMPGSKGIKLHALWDGLLGTSGKLHFHANYAITIQADYPRKVLRELGADKNPKAWSLEGRTLAIEKVYLNGKLSGSTSADSAPELPKGYTSSAKKVAEKQAALAGYRLADLITSSLK